MCVVCVRDERGCWECLGWKKLKKSGDETDTKILSVCSHLVREIDIIL